MIKDPSMDDRLERELDDLSEALFRDAKPVPEHLINRVLESIDEAERPSPSTVSWSATLPLAAGIAAFFALVSASMLTPVGVAGIGALALLYGGSLRLLLIEPLVQ